MECIFCKIIRKKIPAEIVFENKEVISFLDIMPVNKGHCLVLPKKHAEHFLELDRKTLASLMQACQKIGKVMMKSLNAGGFNIILNSDKVAGGEIAHPHFHVIPRYAGDGIKNWQHKNYQEREIQEFAQKIRSFVKRR